MKNSEYLDVILAFNSFVTIIQMFKRFPLLYPLIYFCAPITKILAFLRMEENTRVGVRRRIAQRGSIEHMDYFEHVLPADSPLPTAQEEFTHLGAVALQVTFAGFGPMSDWFYGTICFLLQYPECYKALTEEIRNQFNSYNDITPGALKILPYLHACLEETLRMFPSNNSGLPRYSPVLWLMGNTFQKG